MMSLAIFLSLLFFYSLISRSIERTILTGPIVFTLAGMLVFVAYPRILETGINEEVLFRLAEIGLVLLLFTDASRTDLNRLHLTIVRMLPVAIALIGTRLSLATILFMGWFGPRGLASIVLGLVYLQQELNLPGEPTIRLALIVTVFLSIFAHGLSASTGIGVYARTIAPPDTARPDLPCGKN